MEFTTYTKVFEGLFWFQLLLSVGLVFLSLLIQLRIYYGRWMHRTDIVNFTIACVVLKELDQQFAEGQRRTSVRYQL
jgi:hypothetical protein